MTSINKIIRLIGNRDLGPMETDERIEWTELYYRLHEGEQPERESGY